MSGSMKLAVLGAGNIGTLVGAKLSQVEGAKVLIHARGEHAASLALNGIKMNGIETLDVPNDKFDLSIADVEFNPIFDGLADIILICSKAKDVNNLLSMARRLCHQATKILVLSNGLGHLESAIEEFGPHRVVPATTTHGVWREFPGVINWAGSGAINIGRIDQSPTKDELSEFLEYVELAGLNPIWYDDGRKLIWSKILINIAINPIASITGQRNGDLLQAEMFDMCTEVMLEGAKVARLEGVALDSDADLIDNLQQVLEQTGANTCSMLQDIRNGRETEIAFLNRMIVSRAEKYGMSTPLNQLLSKLIESITLY